MENWRKFLTEISVFEKDAAVNTVLDRMGKSEFYPEVDDARVFVNRQASKFMTRVPMVWAMIKTINQDPDISQIFTLLDQQGSSVIRGNLFVVPINQSVLYYQPIYLQGEQNPLPEFKFVVVIFQDKIIMEESLGEALEGIFEGASFGDNATVDSDNGLDTIELLEKANSAFNQAQDELLAGDLGRYQELIKLAEEYVSLAIEELNK